MNLQMLDFSAQKCSRKSVCINNRSVISQGCQQVLTWVLMLGFCIVYIIYPWCVSNVSMCYLSTYVIKMPS